MKLNSLRLLTPLVISACLTACSSFSPDTIDYKSARAGNNLEVPPDLAQLSSDVRFRRTTDNAISAGDFTKTTAAAGTSNAGSAGVALTSAGDVRMERNGNQRWLVVKRSPEQLWVTVRDFWTQSGFLLTMDDPKLGIIETDWAENRAKIPQDFIRQALGKVLDSLYSTSERDKFRIRLERNAAGETEITVTHRGMVEELRGSNKETSTWTQRPSDPELETEFLRRIMLALGSSDAQSKSAVAGIKTNGAMGATGNAAGKAKLQADGMSLSYPADFASTWRAVGLSLDRSGFTVEDLNRSAGNYYVRYASDKKSDGFLGGIFSDNKDEKTVTQYLVNIKSQGAVSNVTVSSANAKGNLDAAKKIASILATDLR